MTRRTCESDEGLLEALGGVAASVPESEHTDDIRRTFLLKVEAAGARASAGAEAPSTANADLRGRLLPAFGAIAIALVAALVIFTSLGLASLHAMPGNPLYSVKRTIESTRIALGGPGAKVDSLLEQAEERLVELKYINSHGMRDWALAIASDAEEDVREAKREAARLGAGKAREADKKAGGIVVQHEQSITDSLPLIPEPERGPVKQWMDEEIKDYESEPGSEGPQRQAETAGAQPRQRTTERVVSEPRLKDEEVSGETRSSGQAVAEPEHTEQPPVSHNIEPSRVSPEQHSTEDAPVLDRTRESPAAEGTESREASSVPVIRTGEDPASVAGRAE